MAAPPELHAAARNMLAAALATEEERPLVLDAWADALVTIIEHGPKHVHAVIAGCAKLIGHCIEVDSDGLWAIEAINTVTGKRISLDDTDLPACERSAIRAVTATLNDDHHTVAAIVKAAWASEPEDVTLLLAAVARLTADVVRAPGGQQ